VGQMGKDGKRPPSSKLARNTSASQETRRLFEYITKKR
jgi:hypothetical protein